MGGGHLGGPLPGGHLEGLLDLLEGVEGLTQRGPVVNRAALARLPYQDARRRAPDATRDSAAHAGAGPGSGAWPDPAWTWRGRWGGGSGVGDGAAGEGTGEGRTRTALSCRACRTRRAGRPLVRRARQGVQAGIGRWRLSRDLRYGTPYLLEFRIFHHAWGGGHRALAAVAREVAGYLALIAQGYQGLALIALGPGP